MKNSLNQPVDLKKHSNWFILLAVSIVTTAFLLNQINVYSDELNLAFSPFSINVAHAAGAATLSLSPSSTTVGVNQTFTVNVNLNTGGGPVDGVDIFSLHFNPALLQVVDSNSGTTGTQIAPGTVLPNTNINTADNTAGTVQFAQSAAGGTSFTGSGILATITFKGIASGTSAVTMDFTAGSTSDTNAAFQGVDQLASVSNGSYTVDGSAPTVSVTAPANGSTVSGSSTTVSATASDNIGVAGVQFKLDGNNLGAEDTVSPYSISWDTTATTNASHSLTAVARDAAGNTTTSSASTVTVSNVSFDFSLSNGGAKTVTQGSAITNTITATLSAGNAAVVSLAASGLPAGVSSSFSVGTCTPTCSSTLTLTASASASVGTSTITVTGTSGALSHTTTFNLTVNSSTFQRTISIASLEGRSSKVISGTLDVLNSATKALIKSYAYTTNASGTVAITFDIAPQTVYLKAKATPFLTRLLSGVDLNSNVTYSFPQLFTGDINQDNIINSVDYSVLNTNWFTSNAAADLNLDGLVNSIDYSFMNLHWLVTGEQ